MATVDSKTKTLIDTHLSSADSWADGFRTLNVALAVVIAGLGAIVAAEPNFGEYTGMVLGALTAMFGALNKAIDPGEAGERHATRKRALELLKVEADREDNESPFSSDEMKRLVYRAKRDPAAVLEEVITQTSASAAAS